MSMKQRKVFKKFAMLIVTLALVITSVTPAFAKEAAKAPTLNASKATISIGKTFDFNVLNKVKGATYTWTVSNNKVATVNKTNGVVTGVNKGKANINCVYRAAGKSYRLTAQVTVVKAAVKVEIANPVKNLEVKQYYKLKAKLTPASSNDVVTWSSSDKSIAKVDSDGSFVALKEGKVTITAATSSGRKTSITITVGTAQIAEEENDSKAEEASDNTSETKDDVKVIKKIYSEDFAASVGQFTGRGSAVVAQTTAGVAAEGGKGYMSVTGRTANWNGAVVDVTKLVTPGATYRVTAWVRYTSGGGTEVIKSTQETDDSKGTEYLPISGNVDVQKGKWTKIVGNMQVAPSMTKSLIYFEADNLIDFYVDNVVIEQIEAEAVVEEKVEIVEAKAGDVVVSRDFEDGSILDTRAGSTITNTTKYANSGKASVEVARNNGWDGAGIKFNLSNKITKASYFGHTLHVSAYVMYKEGTDTVNFKLNNHMEKADNSDNILSQIPVNKGEWTKIEADCQIADGATGDLIFFETENDGALTFYIDDLDIQVVK